jgi:murein DD-endopeptidase MepM/ murein hydrolase activator NlpD
MKMIKNKRSLLLVFIICLLASIVSYGLDEVTVKENELNAIQNRLKNIQNEKSVNTGNQSKINSNIDRITKNISGLESEIKAINKDIDNTQVKIDEMVGVIEETEKSIVEKTRILEKRLRAMYKAGNVGYVEVLLGSDDFKNLMTRADMVKKIYIHDTNLVESLNDQKKIQEDNKKNLETEKSTLKASKQRIDEKKAVLRVEIDGLKVEKEKLKQDYKALEESEDKFQREADELTNVLKNLKLEKKYVGGQMRWPVPGRTDISSYFGYRIHPVYKKNKLHTGIDIPAPKDTNVVAAQGGTVIYSDWLGSYGRLIMIDHGGGIVTAYGHNNSLVVNVGDKVAAGDVIAKIGSSGLSTGNHSHFEVRKEGKNVNPLDYVSP